MPVNYTSYIKKERLEFVALVMFAIEVEANE